MPLGLVSDEEFEKESSRIDSNWTEATKEKKPEVIDLPKKGRPEGSREVPESLRKIIGETSAIEGRQAGLELAKQFGISPSSTSAYANGSTSTASYNQPSEEIRDHINKSKERISKRARTKLLLALSEITPDKIAAAKLKDISGVAKDMSGIMKDMDTNDSGEKGVNRPTFVFYAPQFRDERNFETIIVNE